MYQSSRGDSSFSSNSKAISFALFSLHFLRCLLDFKNQSVSCFPTASSGCVFCWAAAMQQVVLDQGTAGKGGFLQRQQ